MRTIGFSSRARLAGVSAMVTTLVLLLVPNAPGETNGTSEIEVQEIVDRAIVRAQAQEDAVAQFESMMLSVIESLDGKGVVKKEEKVIFRRYAILGAVYDEMIEKNGRPLTDKELAREKKQKDEFVREVQKRTARGEPPQPEDDQRVSFDREFIDRYNLELSGTEVVRGHGCWIVYFEPRDGELPVHRRIDLALNRSTGKLWITQDDFGLARVEFEMREPFRYWGGLVATIRNTTGRLNFEPVDSDVWMPVDFALELDLRIFFKNIRRRIKTTWSDYRRLDSSIPRTSSFD